MFCDHSDINGQFHAMKQSCSNIVFQSMFSINFNRLLQGIISLEGNSTVMIILQIQHQTVLNASDTSLCQDIQGVTTSTHHCAGHWKKQNQICHSGLDAEFTPSFFDQDGKGKKRTPAGFSQRITLKFTAHTAALELSSSDTFLRFFQLQRPPQWEPRELKRKIINLTIHTT